jgi:hypothetical protein
MTAGKNHDHERGTDCQRGQRTGTVADDGAPNGQNQEKGSDEFSEVLVHICLQVLCFRLWDSECRGGRDSSDRRTISTTLIASENVQLLWQIGFGLSSLKEL